MASSEKQEKLKRETGEHLTVYVYILESFMKPRECGLGRVTVCYCVYFPCLCVIGQVTHKET